MVGIYVLKKFSNIRFSCFSSFNASLYFEFFFFFFFGEFIIVLFLFEFWFHKYEFL